MRCFFYYYNTNLLREHHVETYLPILLGNVA